MGSIVTNATICVVWSFGVLILTFILFNPKHKIRGKLLFVTNTKANARIQEYSNYFVWESIDRSHLYYSPVLSLSGVLVFRVLMFIYFWITILDDELGTGDGLGPPFTWLKYYTNWTFITFGAYSFVGIINCMQRLRYMKKNREDDEAQPSLPTLNRSTTRNYDSNRDLSEKIFMMLGAVSLPCTLFLTVFYWTFIFDGSFQFNDFMYHGLNTIILLVDLVIVRRPMISSHIIFAFCYSYLYLVFMWVFAAFTGDWIYGVLDWSDASGVIMEMMLPILVMITYILTYWIAWVREKCCYPTSIIVPDSSLEIVGVQLPLQDVNEENSVSTNNRHI
eukprot:TRINITY_DN2201_c0_g1_i1.p1 TRINITY_DN2201_c0_g1~~TRINITY_DN2201_c0_g1_i1.p1  ORF type:complete len:334 (-),score=23.24 TRINITY_DN2201_c0_g1_i1:501-1502(-)